MSQLELCRAHTPRAATACILQCSHICTLLYDAIRGCFVDDLYLHDIMRMSRKHMGVQLIGVANKNAVFATLLGPTKRFEAQ